MLAIQQVVFPEGDPDIDSIGACQRQSECDSIVASWSVQWKVLKDKEMKDEARDKMIN